MSGFDTPGASPAGDQTLRFLFEDADVRGEYASLDKAYRDILAIHQYAPGVSRLLGEFLNASVLLSSNLKFEGRLILQARSEGQVPLLMAECDHLARVRGIARGSQQATATNNEQLLANGQLAITIEPSGGQRYQGIVPLVANSLALSLDAYFELSEQLNTRIWLAADGRRACGLLLQQLPEKVTRDQALREEQWNHLCTLSATVQEEELLGLDAPTLLRRLYHEERARLFQPRPVRFRCSCNRERTRNALATLGPVELEDMLREMGTITMDCEFCNQRYRFDRDDLADVLGGGESKTLH